MGTELSGRGWIQHLQCAKSGVDPLTKHPELNGFAVYASDGYYEKTADDRGTDKGGSLSFTKVLTLVTFPVESVKY